MSILEVLTYEIKSATVMTMKIPYEELNDNVYDILPKLLVPRNLEKICKYYS